MNHRWLAPLVLLAAPPIAAAPEMAIPPPTSEAERPVLIARYVQADPIGLAGGANRYVYADAEPLSGTDPAGLANSAAVKWMQRGCTCQDIRVNEMDLELKPDWFKTVWDPARAYGHWWFRVGDQSFGWWPADQVSGDKAAIYPGAPGRLNAGSENDPLHEDIPRRSHKVRTFDGPQPGQTCTETCDRAKQCVRDHAAAYPTSSNGRWQLLGNSCRTFVDSLLDLCKLKRARE